MEWPFGKKKYSEPKFLENEIQLSTSIEKTQHKEVFLMIVKSDPEITSAIIATTKIEAGGYKISDSAKEMLPKINWDEKLEPSYEVVSVSVSELFSDTKHHSYSEVIERARERGYEVVPIALVPEICLNYKKDEEKIIVTNTISTIGSTLLFTCGLSDFDQKRWLGQVGARFSNKFELLFVKRI